MLPLIELSHRCDLLIRCSFPVCHLQLWNKITLGRRKCLSFSHNVNLLYIKVAIIRKTCQCNSSILMHDMFEGKKNSMRYSKTASSHEVLTFGNLVQVFLHEPSDMLIVDVFWGICNWSTLSNSLFRVIYAHLSWLLHHLWTPFNTWTTQNCCLKLHTLPHPCWL